MNQSRQKINYCSTLTTKGWSLIPFFAHFRELEHFYFQIKLMELTISLYLTSCVKSVKNYERGKFTTMYFLTTNEIYQRGFGSCKYLVMFLNKTSREWIISFNRRISRDEDGFLFFIYFIWQSIWNVLIPGES